MAELTIAFVDLTGSVSMFESLGNDRATRAVTELTQWIAAMGRQHGGKVIKMLGDGVLMSFTTNAMAVETMTQIQQEHGRRVAQRPSGLKLMMQMGLARGQVVQVDGDCFGDAVNLASRLSDLAGPEQILVADSVIRTLPARSGIRLRNLGPMQIKGRTELCEVFRIEWQTEMLSEFLTLPADLHQLDTQTDSVYGEIELGWLDTSQAFNLKDLPLKIGRAPEAAFVVNDPRVSRFHASIDMRSGNCVLEDISSYGSWVRFDQTENAICLRRQACVLHGNGEMAMGAPFSDFSAPTVRFKLVEGRMVLGHGAGATRLPSRAGPT